jgi:hypothetical protein
MHGENFGCLYNPNTFEIQDIAPSYDHNSADFDGAIPDLDVPSIVTPALARHSDVIENIKSGKLEIAVNSVGDWLTEEQRAGIKAVGQVLIEEYEKYSVKSLNICSSESVTNNRYSHTKKIILPETPNTDKNSEFER